MPGSLLADIRPEGLSDRKGTGPLVLARITERRAVVMRARCVSLILIALALRASPAGAGVIRGVVRAPAPDAVIYLERIPNRLERQLARKSAPAIVGQAHGQFTPSVLAIAAGTTVTFRNVDAVYHNVFSVSSARHFDIGKYSPRTQRKVRFDRPGIVRIFCDIDPGESGYIYVTPNHAYTRPDASGAFELPGLPRGTYRLRLWCPGQDLVTREVELPRWGDVNVELRL